MRKIKYILAFVLTLVFTNVFLTSCHNDEKPEAVIDEGLVGTWASLDNKKDFHEEIEFQANGSVTSTLYANRKALDVRFVDADGVCHKVKGNFCTESDMVKLSKIQVYDYEEYHDWNWHGLEILENVADMNYLMQARYSLSHNGDTLILHSSTADGMEDNIYIRKAK
jgi:hypothetical protein